MRHAVRMIAQNAGLAAVVIVSLGVGIGVNTVVFSWIQAVLFKPMPGVSGAASFHAGRTPHRRRPLPGRVLAGVPRPAGAPALVPRACIAFRMLPLYVGEAGPRRAGRSGCSCPTTTSRRSAFARRLGRFLRPEEVDAPGGEPVAVISHGLWQTRFGGAPSAVGQTIRVNGRDLTIIGVTPRGFQGTVLGLNSTSGFRRRWRRRDQRLARARGPQRPRLLRHGTAAAAARRARRRKPSSTPRCASWRRRTRRRTRRCEARCFRSGSRRAGRSGCWRPRSAVLQAIMLLLLLAVCGNTANLVLARASARQREMGVRLALGAAPWRVVSLLLTENVVLASLGAALGAAIAVWGTQALRIVPLSGLPIRFQTSVDAAGLAFAMILGVGCGLLFGAAPARAARARRPAAGVPVGIAERQAGAGCATC